MKKKVTFIFGTRPEAIKMAPLIQVLAREGNYHTEVFLTGQHPTMAREVLEWFEIKPDFEHSLVRIHNDLNELVSQLVNVLGDWLKQSKPDLVVVQGDTASAYAGSLAAFNLQIPIAHLEAGLRTNDMHSPFPEEAYRQMISRLSTLNMCPTPSNKRNLLAEQIPEASIMVTGNTVVDAFKVVRERMRENKIHTDLPISIPDHDLVLVTTHRRENLEQGITEIAESIAYLAQEYKELNFVLPLHPNPAVRAKILPVLEGRDNVFLIEPLGYPEFITILSRSRFVLTDSGGVQEEAPILGIPALVLRETTERPEGVESGGVVLVGANKSQILTTVKSLMNSQDIYESMSTASNPYGDGQASKRCLSLINEFFNFGNRSSEFING